jgi:hypothetical protein
MTGRVLTRLSRERFATCVADGGARTLAGASNAAALNRIATRGTNGTRESPAEACGSAGRRSPWASIVIAVGVVILVLAVELWAAHRAPARDGTVASEVATEVSTTLGEVAASSILIGPAD